MDHNEYGLELLARERLEAARAFAARQALVARARGQESRAGLSLMHRVRRRLGDAALRLLGMAGGRGRCRAVHDPGARRQ